MAQHFLLSAKARTLSLKASIRPVRMRHTRHSASCAGPSPMASRFARVVGASISTASTPAASSIARRAFVTSASPVGTIFASRKMAFTDLLAAICIFVNGAKGIAALQLSRDLDCQYKTAFVLSHKLRDALAAERKASCLMARSRSTVPISAVTFALLTSKKNVLTVALPNTRPASAVSLLPSANAPGAL